MKVSEFLINEQQSFLLGAFFGRFQLSKDGRYIYSTSSYKTSKFVKDQEFYKYSKANHLSKLNNFSKYDIWTTTPPHSIKRSAFSAVLENDLQLNTEKFLNKLYAKILSSNLVSAPYLTEDKKMFIRAFIELRGSIDGKADYIAQDYFYDNLFELKRVRLLIDYMNVPIEILNFNFRDLQNQYITGKNKRNSQLRIQLSWYAENIGLMSVYKVAIIENAYTNYFPINKTNEVVYFKVPEKNRRNSTTFEQRILKYSAQIFGKDLDALQISKLRDELGFDSGTVDQFIRNKAIIELVRLFTPDDCACCKDSYNITDRSFIHRKTNRPYFEIHHVISLNNTVELDDENNLVKLCPVCHSALKAGVGLADTQKEFVRKILDNSPNSLEFSKHIYDSEDLEYIVNKIHGALR